MHQSAVKSTLFTLQAFDILGKLCHKTQEIFWESVSWKGVDPVEESVALTLLIKLQREQCITTSSMSHCH